MAFFETFWTWLNGQLANYIGDNTARAATALEPAVITLGTFYVMAWGWLLLTGRLEEPIIAGLKRILTLAAIVGVGLRLWLYNSLIVDTFYHAPTQLAAMIIGSTDPVQTIDVIWERGGSVAATLWNNGGVFNGDFGFYIAGAVVWTLMGLLCVYTMFLIALSSTALAILLALGPLFITSLFFNATRRFFDAWVAQLVNYGFITILTILAAALLLQIVASYATQTAALGNAVVTVDALNMVLMSTLVFLFMRQIMPIAAGLAGGVSMTTFNIVHRSVIYGGGIGRRLAAGGVAIAASQLSGRSRRQGL